MSFQAGGIAVVLRSRERLTSDCGIADQPRGAFDGVVVAHNPGCALGQDGSLVLPDFSAPG